VAFRPAARPTTRAIRLAHFYRAAWGKLAQTLSHGINSYHGSSYLTISVGNRYGDRTPNFHYISDFIHHLSAPIPTAGRRIERRSVHGFSGRGVQGQDQGTRQDNIALYRRTDPGSGGVVPPRGYLKRMREVARENGILFIADEVVTAFGRVGHWFASQDVFGIEPDMIVSAKGLTSGYLPLGVTIYSDAIHEAISQPGPEVWFAHGFTYSGHPVCCAAALKNIEIIEREDLLAHARKVGDHFERRLKELEALRIVGEARGMRMMMCVEFVADKATKAHLPDEINISKRISNECEARATGAADGPSRCDRRPDAVDQGGHFLVDTLGGREDARPGERRHAAALVAAYSARRQLDRRQKNVFGAVGHVDLAADLDGAELLRQCQRLVISRRHRQDQAVDTPVFCPGGETAHRLMAETASAPRREDRIADLDRQAGFAQGGELHGQVMAIERAQNFSVSSARWLDRPGAEGGIGAQLIETQLGHPVFLEPDIGNAEAE
jgi:hypothetical protein